MVQKDISYITRGFVRQECSVFGAILSDEDCDRIIAEVARLTERGEFHHTGVYWSANRLAADNRIHPQLPG